MGIKLFEIKVNRLFGKGMEIHLEEVYCEFAIDVMELVFMLIGRLQILWKLRKVLSVVGTFGIGAFMYAEVFTVFLWNEDAATVRTTQSEWTVEYVGFIKTPVTDFTKILTFGTIVFI